MIQLFTYGSLQNEEIQDNLFGRLLKGTREKLIGYVLKRILIEEEFGLIEYPIIIETKNENDYIDGIVYEITDKELYQTDLYEGIHYKRVEVQLVSGQKAWAYSTQDLTNY